jgi:hypothetical protein
MFEAMIDERLRLTRDELYGLVWSEPMATLAPKYGLSDVGMAKICKKLRIPRPWRGYWARKDAGQKLKQTPLPHLPPSTPRAMLEVTINRGVVGNADTFEGPAADQARFEARPESKIVVSERLSDPHPLVAQTVKALRGAKSDKGVLIPKAKNCLAVRVSLSSADRAACILDALIKALDQRNFITSVKQRGDAFETTVRVGEEDIEFRLDETVQRVDRKAGEKDKSRYHFAEWEWVPTGRLTLRIENYRSDGVRKSWTDGGKQRLEDSLNNFVVKLVEVAERSKIYRLELEEREKERRAQEERRALAAKKREEEAARIRALNDAADKWYNARSIRAYVEAVRSTLSTISPELHDHELIEWLDWASSYADRVDPLIPTPRIPEDPEPPKPSWEFRYS